MIKNTCIKVGIKVKPAQNSQSIVKHQQNPGGPPNLIINLPKDNRKFKVDAIHDANTSHQTTFKDLQINQMVTKFIQGFNITIMAYGQTGAGKTYAMEGNATEPGIIKQAIRMIYQSIPKQSVVSCSFIQLYNQKIFDMLSDDYTNSDCLKLRWESERDFIVEDLSYHKASSASQLQKLWKKGRKNRITAANKVNDMSSRSHTIFKITLSDEDEEGNYRERDIMFIDLAGSEKLVDESGKLSKQSIQINKSLFVLRKVIKILEESSVHKKQLYVPYRDSKLTSLLKKALGGNCLTMLIACIDSTYSQKQETLLTLGYAISTGRIQNSATVNIDHQALENKRLKHQNQCLKKQLQAAVKQVEILTRKDKMEAERKSMNQYSHKIIQCISTIRELIKSNKELREELDQQRKIKSQQKMEIQMLMQERYMSRKLNSLRESPQHQDKMAIPRNNYSPNQQKEYKKTPSRLIKLKEIEETPKYASKDRPRKDLNNMKQRHSVINKRTRYVVLKTEPDQLISSAY